MGSQKQEAHGLFSVPMALVPSQHGRGSHTFGCPSRFFLQVLWLQVLIHHELISPTLLSAFQLPEVMSLLLEHLFHI